MLAYIASADLSATLGNTVFVLVSFIVLMFLLKKFAWKNISAIIKERQEKIAKDLETAEQKRQEAEQVQAQADQIIQEARQEARTIIATAQKNGEHLQNELVQEGHATVANLKETAQREIQTMRQECITDLEKHIGELSIELASKIIQREINADTHQQLIEEFIEGLES